MKNIATYNLFVLIYYQTTQGVTKEHAEEPIQKPEICTICTHSRVN